MNSRRQGLVSMPEVFKTRISVWSREEDNWERNCKKTSPHRWTTDWVSWDEEKGRVKYDCQGVRVAEKRIRTGLGQCKTGKHLELSV